MSNTKYTESDLREELGPEGIDRLIDAVPYYNRREKLVELGFADHWNASLLMAWAQFAPVVLENIPGAKITAAGEIHRDKTRDELEVIAIRDELYKRNRD